VRVCVYIACPRGALSSMVRTPVHRGVSVKYNLKRCTAAPLFIFWNAEYVPVPFAF
jgi:hypothetical protein